MQQCQNLYAGAGIFGVEMFVMKGGELALNEVAPRPHNSGHYTIEACCTSQFEQHLRAISGLPLGDASMTVKSRLVNLHFVMRLAIFHHEKHISSLYK